VFGGLINDVVPAALIGRFFGLFRAVSLLAGVIFNFWLIGHAEEHFRAIFLGLGVLYGFGLTLMCLRVKEGDYPPPAKEPIPGFVAQVKGYFRECFTHPFYVCLFVALMLANLSGGPANSFSIFYAKSLDMDMSAYGRLLVVTYVISFALSFVLGWLADRFHPIRVGMVALALYGGVMVWGGLTATTVERFSLVFVMHGVLQGTYMTGTASIGQRLFPAAKFAQFSSAAGIVGAAGYILLPPVTGALLDAGGHVYRHTFTASGVIALVALAVFFVVHRRFTRLTGKNGWSSPRLEMSSAPAGK
jgi:MFS family permease